MVVRTIKFLFSAILSVLFLFATNVYAMEVDFADPAVAAQLQQWIAAQEPDALLNITDDGVSIQASSTVQVIFIFTLIALAPTLLIMLTSFTRIIIVMHFLRSALGTNQMPPNQILIGLALFLTLFLMGGTFEQIHEMAILPYLAGEITQTEVIDLGMEPIREFMFRQVGINELALFANLAGETYYDIADIPNRVLIPAFILGELTIGFIFGFFLFLPFIVIDMVVATVLMAMGMMMLPPAMISTPFKILLFIMIDGWRLVMELVVTTFA